VAAIFCDLQDVVEVSVTVEGRRGPLESRLPRPGLRMVVQQALAAQSQELCPGDGNISVRRTCCASTGRGCKLCVTSLRGSTSTGMWTTADGRHLWLPFVHRNPGVRAGKLDTWSAGGLPVGLSLMENVVKGICRGSFRAESWPRQAKARRGHHLHDEAMMPGSGATLHCLSMTWKLPTISRPKTADGEDQADL